jgi:hypothetical protein
MREEASVSLGENAIADFMVDKFLIGNHQETCLHSSNKKPTEV